MVESDKENIFIEYLKSQPFYGMMMLKYFKNLDTVNNKSNAEIIDLYNTIKKWFFDKSNQKIVFSLRKQYANEIKENRKKIKPDLVYEKRQALPSIGSVKNYVGMHDED